ncbi:TrkH family potassium uptake protein, partial [bacterium]|nr:TrkH family potassium uptake protein [bacterium]
MRFNIQLKEQYKAIAAYTGYILILVSMLELSPVLITFFYPGELVHAFGFLIPAVSLLVIGIVLWILFRSSRSTVLTVTEGGVIVLFCWIITFIFSALPFIILSGLNFTQAIFESVSGLTTTGL